MLDRKVRYLQFALNDDLAVARRVIPQLPRNERILVEAGTPFIKREGMAGIRALRRLWVGMLVADLKVSDGAAEEVAMVHQAGASAVTALGSAPTATLDRFIAACRHYEALAMLDMLGVDDPMAVLRPLKLPPDVVILHRGRDEETVRGKTIEYRHVARIRSKYDVVISAAGGVDLGEARSAIFNGANIVVVNLVRPESGWQGISIAGDVGALAKEFLATVA